MGSPNAVPVPWHSRQLMASRAQNNLRKCINRFGKQYVHVIICSCFFICPVIFVHVFDFLGTKTSKLFLTSGAVALSASAARSTRLT